MKLLNLSYDSIKDKKLDKHLNIIFNKYQKKFSLLISKAVQQKTNSIGLWLSNPISRITMESKLYYNYCIAIFLKKKINNYQNLEKVIVDTPELAQTLQSFIKRKNLQVELEKNNNYKLPLLQHINSIYFFLKFFVKKIYQIYICKIINRNKKKVLEKKIILIDTFAVPGYYSKDRYFNGLLESLNKNYRKIIYFTPTIAYTRVKNYHKVYRELKNSKSQFILKEDFLKFSDIFYAFFYCIKIKFFNFKKLIQEDIDFSLLFNSDLKDKNGDEMMIEGILNYKFIQRLKEKKIDIRLFINWWENQPIDKGLCKGIQTFYSSSKLIGYLGYYPRQFELQLSPLKIESDFNYVPKIIAVIGKKIKKKITLFNTKQKVITAPAFRYSYLWSMKKKNSKKKINILFALPITEYDSSMIIDMIPVSLLQEQKVNILIKPHPTMNKKKLNKYLNKFNKGTFRIIEGRIDKNLAKIDILVSSMSITCLEALSLGIPVINIHRKTGMSYNSIPEEIPKMLWKHCSSQKEVYKASKYFIKNRLVQLNKRKKYAKKIRQNFFEPITKKKVLNFIN